MAEPTRFDLVIADSSALVALATCQALELLDRLTARIRVPTAVFQEVVVQGKPQARALREYLQGKVEDVDAAEIVVDASSLGRGELEAMVLFKRARADVLLVDDARARKIARLNQIPVIGSLGVLVLAKDEGLVTSIRPQVELLRNSELFLAENLLRKVLEIAGETGVL